MEIGPEFKMTLKTKLFLWLYRRFGSISQWFINHCDCVEGKSHPCPKCGAEMKTCCQLYSETHQTFEQMAKEPHSCGPSEWICQKCGYKEYATR